MNKIFIFGKPGGGKSSLGKKISKITGINLHALDLIEYLPNGERVSPAEYKVKHAATINTERWVVEGFGQPESFWVTIDAADTLVYIDLPYYIHYWWVTKRLLKGLFVKPEGWPEGSSLLKGTIASWKFLRLSPKFWTDELFEKIQARGKDKKIYRITSVKAMTSFCESL